MVAGPRRLPVDVEVHAVIYRAHRPPGRRQRRRRSRREVSCHGAKERVKVGQAGVCQESQPGGGAGESEKETNPQEEVSCHGAKERVKVGQAGVCQESQPGGGAGESEKETNPQEYRCQLRQDRPGLSLHGSKVRDESEGTVQGHPQIADLGGGSQKLLELRCLVLLLVAGSTSCWPARDFAERRLDGAAPGGGLRNSVLPAPCVVIAGDRLLNNELADILHRWTPDLVLLTETWLKPHLALDVPGYVCHRADRHAGPRGGVAVLVRCHIPHYRRAVPALAAAEAVAVRLTSTRPALTVAAVYLQPNRVLPAADLLLLARLDGAVLLAGDFNCRHTRWGCAADTFRGRALLRFTAACDLTIHAPPSPTYCPTRANQRPSVLDLCLTTQRLTVVSLAVLSDLASDHLPVVGVLQGLLAAGPPLRRRDYQRADWPAFRRHLDDQLDLGLTVATPEDLDDVVERFAAAIGCAERAAIPLRPVRPGGKPLPPPLRALIRMRNAARRCWQRLRHPQALEEYRYYKGRCRRAVTDWQASQHLLALQSLSAQTGSVWGYVRGLRSRAAGVPPLQSGQRFLDDPRDKAELLAGHFESTFVPHAVPAAGPTAAAFRDLPPLPLPAAVGSLLVTPREVERAVGRLKLGKAPGPDGVRPVLVKSLSRKALIYFTKLCNFSLLLAHFPLPWRHAVIVPVPKTHPASPDVAQYRPISLLSCLSKVFERMLLGRLGLHLAVHGSLPDFQFGFRRHLSALHAVAYVSDLITAGFNRRAHSILVLLDLKRAFDSVHHAALVHKLRQTELSPHLLNLLQSFLADRTFAVRVGGALSGIHRVAAGVPQGAILSPTLFAVFLADMAPPPGATLALYADDTAVLVTGDDAQVLQAQAQVALRHLSGYMASWGILPNPAKTQVLFCTKRRRRPPAPLVLLGVLLPYLPAVKYLGVLLDATFTWQPHITAAVRKTRILHRTLRPVLGARSGVPQPTRLLVYKTYILPVLLYASVVWATLPRTCWRPINSVLHAGLRLVLGYPLWTPVELLYRLSGLRRPVEMVAAFAQRFFRRNERSLNPGGSQKLLELRCLVLLLVAGSTSCWPARDFAERRLDGAAPGGGLRNSVLPAPCVVIAGDRLLNNELADILHRWTPDLVLLTETWLKPHLALDVPGYVCHRADRHAGPRGGVAVLVRCHIPHYRRAVPALAAAEAVAVRLTSTRPALTVAAVYLQPNRVLPAADLLLLARLDGAVLLAGDFNCRHTRWGCAADTFRGRALLRFTAACDLTIHAPPSPTYCPTRANQRPSVLDLCLTTQRLTVVSLAVLSDLASDHLPVVGVLQGLLAAGPPLRRRDYQRADWPAFRRHLDDQLDLGLTVATPEDLDDVVERFAAAIGCAERAAIPLRPVRPGGKPLPPPLRALIRMRNAARRCWQRLRHPQALEEYRYYKGRCRRAVTDWQASQHLLALQSLSAQTGSVWGYVRGLRSRAAGVPPLQSGQRFLDDPRDKAELLAGHFESTFVPHAVPAAGPTAAAFRDLPPLPLPAAVGSLLVTPREVERAVGRLKLGKAPGPDGVRPVLVKSLSRKALIYFTKLCNFSLLLAHFPLPWRHAVIVPVPKTHPASPDVAQYRPISLLSCLSKVFERMLLGRLGLHLAVHGSLPDFQFGFRRHLSALHAVAYVSDLITAGFNRRAHSILVLLDLKRAFDSVHHAALVHKLRQTELSPHLLNLLQSFLADRTFAVRVGGALSGIHRVAAGVPQGAILSPTLFAVFLADMAPPPGATLALYADDTAVLVTGDDAQVLQAQAQVALRHLSGYMASWGILPNPAKTQVLFCTKRRRRPPAPLVLLGVLLPYLPAVKYLGVLLDATFTWQPHITAAVRKTRILHRTLRPVLGARSGVPQPTRLLVYKTYILPVLLYASVVWATLPRTCWRPINSVLHAGLRLVLGYPLWTPVELLYRLSGLRRPVEMVAAFAQRFFRRNERSLNPLVRSIGDYDVAEPHAHPRIRDFLRADPP
ncbi:uncharacterized protein LOC134544777 [Bacillus rossius redtenbacheri]|uniref:uncharacterized protein LOC134544777 n=1 Tax=Bacillus rossius redtenbacheri TaxID=93214 RepID=UPI002FDDAF2B